MNDEMKKTARKAPAAAQRAYTKERAAFKPLLLTNPNYFGNLLESAFKAVLPISGNTHYEDGVPRIPAAMALTASKSPC